MKINRSKFLIIIIILTAMFVRFWGINFGLPGKTIIDEDTFIYQSLYSGWQKLRPVNFFHPQFVPLLLLTEYAIFFIIGIFLKIFNNPQNFLIYYLKDPTYLILIGRMTMAFFGVLTVWLIYFIGKKFFNNRVGLISGLFLCFCFTHVKESHYIKQDILLTLLILGTLYFLLKIIELGKLKYYLFFACIFGFAISTKLNSLIFVPVIFLGFIFSTSNKKIKYMLISMMVVIIIFFLINPYILIEPKRAFDNIIALSKEMKIIYPQHLLGYPVWWWFVNVYLPQGMGMVLFMLGLFGFILNTFKAKSNKNVLLIPIFPLLFLITVDLWTKMHSARYGLPIVPFWILSAAIFIDFILHFIKNIKLQKYILILICVAVCWQSLVRIIKFDYLLIKKDTRSQAKVWIEKNIPVNSKIFLETSFKPEYAAYFNANLNLNIDGIDRRIADAKKFNQSLIYLQAIKESNKIKIGYDIVVSSKINVKMDLITNEGIIIDNVDSFINEKIKYLVLSSWAIGEEPSDYFKKSLNDNYELIKIFYNNPNFPQDPHLVDLNIKILDQTNIFDKNIIFGPEIRIYKIKNTYEI